VEKSNVNARPSRRHFSGTIALAAAGMSSSRARAGTLSAGQIVDRIKQNLGVPWREGPTDTFKSGGPETPVSGIATTVMSTFDVLRRAAKSGRNMIITHEPTYWTGNDDTRNFVNEALYKQKLQFITEHNMAVWRFHDNLHARRPDMTSVGLAQVLGWDKYTSKDEPRVYTLPPVALRDLAKDVEKRLNIKAIRVIGDPNRKVSRAGIMQGAAPFHAATVLANVDLVLAGEQREWEGVEYAFDTNSTGTPKSMILVGHWVSEEPGMRLCAEWLKTFVTEVPVEWIPAGDPFWRP
jgi:putative NIF3 family GTP cyclohydrolase 1 type 2